MNDLKLTIDLLPRGAWGNDFSKTLPKKNWDALRNYCYEQANHRCEICGKIEPELDAHEVWEFDIDLKIQILIDIIALCSACHGVKHMRNSERIGYGKQSKAHFLRINKCSEMELANHYAKAVFLFEERNKVLRWRIIADLSKFGGKDFEVKEKNIPFIKNPYEDIEVVTSRPNEIFSVIRTEDNSNILEPKVRSIKVDNHEGSITVISDYTNKITWIGDGKTLKTKYNVVGKFKTKFNVENLTCAKIQFKLIGNGGETISQPFRLDKAI